MILQCGFFFDVYDFENFYKNELFDMKKFNNLNLNFKHKIISNMSSIQYKNNKTYLKNYEGFVFKINESTVVYMNNISDNWITNIEYTAKKYNKRALYIFIDSESIYKGYELYYYIGKEKRIIYNIKNGRKWDFYIDGPQQYFEEGDTYSEKIVSNKFTLDKIKYFCSNIGVNLEDGSIYKNVGDIIYTYIEKENN